MAFLQQILDWAIANPGAAAWILFGILTASVALYHRVRPTIKAYVDATTVSWDDHVVETLDGFFAKLDWMIGLVEVVLPLLASRGRRTPPGTAPPPPSRNP